MIVNSAPQNEAVLSNVGQIGEFRIRNSAKAFNILSSGLYANKIRAIIRELSCNAVDSHVAAGKKDTPFDVHLPTQLDPYFSIRDYGTGLTHDQVTNIYTTYFESTKTESNEFIGALGLGSKSPFSYTDNFTVTAIKDCKKGIYTAFINEMGVPSIALMMSEDTDEPSGVEVKFSVNDYYDYRKFQYEAQHVYKRFSLQPIVTGCNGFTPDKVEYETKDIIPGVNSVKGERQCYAVMGNIGYPIDIPNADSLGELRNLLSCGLEMHFAIGELDFQASREGLSYIPQTIDSIKKKLEAVNAQLTVHLSTEANALTNMWERANFLVAKHGTTLWAGAVSKYIKDTNFELIDPAYHHHLKAFKLTVKDLATKYNITIRGFEKSSYQLSGTNLKPSTEYGKTLNAQGGHDHIEYWSIGPYLNTFFVINDSKVGALQRAKYHWRKAVKQSAHRSDNVYVIEAADKLKPIKANEFYKDIANPPDKQRMVASELTVKPRDNNDRGRNVTILKLIEKSKTGSYYSEKIVTWKDEGKSDTFDKSATHYYLPLSGFSVLGKFNHVVEAKELFRMLTNCGVPALTKINIYGVRKGDIDAVKGMKNWVNLEDHIAEVLSKLDSKFLMSLVMKSLDRFTVVHYNKDVVSKVDAGSPYAKLATQFQGIKPPEVNMSDLQRLCARYTTTNPVNLTDLTKKFVDECEAVYKRYPLFSSLDSRVKASDIAEYINMIDTKKGI